MDGEEQLHASKLTMAGKPLEGREPEQVAEDDEDHLDGDAELSAEISPEAESMLSRLLDADRKPDSDAVAMVFVSTLRSQLQITARRYLRLEPQRSDLSCRLQRREI